MTRNWGAATGEDDPKLDGPKKMNPNLDPSLILKIMLFPTLSAGDFPYLAAPDGKLHEKGTGLTLQ